MLRALWPNREFATWGRIKYAFYLMTHPADGFWDLKHAKRGSFGVAVFLMCFYFFAFLIRRQLTEWYFIFAMAEHLNIFSELVSQVGPFVLWVISLWCVTTLLDGEGTMKDIFTATFYALVPLAMANIVAAGASHILTGRERMILDLIMNFGMVWSLGLIFMSVVITHQYTVLKSLVIVVISLVGMVVMMVLGLLVFFLVQQLVGFAMEIYMEVLIRMTE